MPGMPFYGITHKVPFRLLPVWRRVCCRRQWHAWDEVFSPAADPGERHYLVCDACQLMVYLLRVDETYVDQRRAGPDDGAEHNPSIGTERETWT